MSPKNPYENARKNRAAADASKNAEEELRAYKASIRREEERKRIERDAAFGVANRALEAVRILVRDLRKANALSPAARTELAALQLGESINRLLLDDRPLDRELRRETPKQDPARD